MARYHIWTIGCQMNKADSDQVSKELERMGYEASSDIESASVVILNSCVVRQSAEDRVYNKLHSLKSLKHRHSPLIALTGCMVDSKIDALAKRFPHVDLFLRPGSFAELLDVVGDRIKPGERLIERTSPPRPHGPTTYVTVIQGCNNFCSYCIVPYRRGRERSVPPQEIVCQVQELVSQGVKEVTLLGQNVDSYGHDLPSSPRLSQVIQELDPIPGLERIRFLTNHPKDMSPDLIEAIARLRKVCEHISLPVQSGDDEILGAMKRCYNIGEYRQLIDRIRNTIPGVTLSTDVIIGFPGESEEQFQRTLDLIEEIRFDKVHVAAYSPRPGTAAARLSDNVPLQLKKERWHQVEKVQERIAAEINASLVGSSAEVLVEGEHRGKWQGRTRGNKLVFFKDESHRLGQMVKTKIEKASAWALQGKLEV